VVSWLHSFVKCREWTFLKFSSTCFGKYCITRCSCISIV
jgi:hypothetical protein